MSSQHIQFASKRAAWLTSILVPVALSVTACAGPSQSGAMAAQPVGAEAEPADRADSAAMGHAFAASHCSSCHAVELDGLSPEPLAPRFEAIVNREGLSRETLIPWLDNSHNFPRMMQFEIAPERIANLADYMLTLQHPDFRPVPQ